jgi:hypothetical protein
MKTGSPPPTSLLCPKSSESSPPTSLSSLKSHRIAALPLPLPPLSLSLSQEGRAETKPAGRKGSSSSSPAAEEDDDGTALARSANPRRGRPRARLPSLCWLATLVGRVCAGESSSQGGQKQELPSSSSSSSSSASASPSSPLRPATFAPPGWTPAAHVDLQQVWLSTSTSAPPRDFSHSLARASPLTSSCLLDAILHRCGPPSPTSPPLFDSTL